MIFGQNWHRATRIILSVISAASYSVKVQLTVINIFSYCFFHSVGHKKEKTEILFPTKYFFLGATKLVLIFIHFDIRRLFFPKYKYFFLVLRTASLIELFLWGMLCLGFIKNVVYRYFLLHCGLETFCYWIRTGSWSYWKFMYSIVFYSKIEIKIINLYQFCNPGPRG